MPFPLLQDRELAGRRTMPRRARRHARQAHQPVAVIDMHHLPLKADDQVKRPVERPFLQPTIAARLHHLTIGNRGPDNSFAQRLKGNHGGKRQQERHHAHKDFLSHNARKRQPTSGFPLAILNPSVAQVRA